MSWWDFSNGKFGLPFQGKARGNKAALPNLLCMLFYCFHNPLNPSMDYGIFNMHTDVNACDCTWGAYGHRKSDCTFFTVTTFTQFSGYCCFKTHQFLCTWAHFAACRHRKSHCKKTRTPHLPNPASQKDKRVSQQLPWWLVHAARGVRDTLQ